MEYRENGPCLLVRSIISLLILRPRGASQLDFFFVRYFFLSPARTQFDQQTEKNILSPVSTFFFFLHKKKWDSDIIPRTPEKKYVFMAPARTRERKGPQKNAEESICRYHKNEGKNLLHAKLVNYFLLRRLRPSVMNINKCIYFFLCQPKSSDK